MQPAQLEAPGLDCWQACAAAAAVATEVLFGASPAWFGASSLAAPVSPAATAASAGTPTPSEDVLAASDSVVKTSAAPATGTAGRGSMVSRGSTGTDFD